MDPVLAAAIISAVFSGTAALAAGVSCFCQFRWKRQENKNETGVSLTTTQVETPYASDNEEEDEGEDIEKGKTGNYKELKSPTKNLKTHDKVKKVTTNELHINFKDKNAMQEFTGTATASKAPEAAGSAAAGEGDLKGRILIAVNNLFSHNSSPVMNKENNNVASAPQSSAVPLDTDELKVKLRQLELEQQQKSNDNNTTTRTTLFGQAFGAFIATSPHPSRPASRQSSPEDSENETTEDSDAERVGSITHRLPTVVSSYRPDKDKNTVPHPSKPHKRHKIIEEEEEEETEEEVEKKEEKKEKTSNEVTIKMKTTVVETTENKDNNELVNPIETDQPHNSTDSTTPLGDHPYPLAAYGWDN